AARRRIITNAHLSHVARRIALDAGALDDVGVAQADEGAGRESEVLGGRRGPEVVLLYIKEAAELERSGTGRRVLGVVDGLQFLDTTLRVVLDHELQRS